MLERLNVLTLSSAFAEQLFNLIDFMKKIVSTFNNFLNSDFDFVLLLLIILIIIVGLIMVYSSSSLEAYKKVGDAHYYLKKQIQNMFIGALIFFYTSIILKLNKLKRYSVFLLFIGILLLLIVFVPGIGTRVGGAYRWINFGVFKLQPSEIIKILIIIFFAYFYEKNKKNLSDLNHQKKYFIPLFTLSIGICFLVVIEPDYSTAILIFLLSISLLFIMGFSIFYIFTGVVLMSIPSFLYIVYFPYRMKRILAYINPWSDPLDKGYHIIQSYMAISTGGISGKGIGNSVQKLGYLPEAHTDFIFSIIGEELGLIGSLFIIVIYILIIWRGFKISYNNRYNLFNYILAFGITLMFALQVIINVSVVTGLIPTTGITLPFISYGGSSLIVFLAGAGLLINISKEGL